MKIKPDILFWVLRKGLRIVYEFTFIFFNKNDVESRMKNKLLQLL